MFVGVGGSGGITLRYAWREVQRRLGTHEMLPCFQFVHFDLPPRFDGYRDPLVPRVLSLDNEMYTPLAEPTWGWETYHDQLTMDERRMRASVGWRPYPPEAVPPPVDGAGQRRSVGRAVAVLEKEKILSRLRAATNDLQGQAAAAASEEVGRLLGENIVGELPDPTRTYHAFVVGSFVGGSGSGMFLDVLQLLRTCSPNDPGLSNPYLVAFLPDVFTYASGEGIAPNTLAAMSEFISAFRVEHAESLLPAEAEFLGGVNVSPTLDIPAFVIGRTNVGSGGGSNGVAFASAREVYRFTGAALAAYATDPRIQASIQSTIPNLRGKPHRDAYFFASHEETDNQPFLSFGYGRVSLGRTMFRQYASERLARLAIDRLLALDQPEGSTVESLAQSLRFPFFERSGLRELEDGSGGATNQVLDALRSVSDVKIAAESVSARVLKEYDETLREFSGEEARRSVSDAWRAQADEESKKLADGRATRAEAWTRDIQHRLCDLVVETAAQYGLPVTIRLVSLLEHQVAAAAMELEDEAGRLSGKVREALDAADQVFNLVRSKIKGQATEFRAYVGRREYALGRDEEIKTRHEATSLLRDAGERLLPQLREALEKAADRLGDDVHQPDRYRNIVSEWPAGSVVPASFKPPPNEQVLEPVDPKVFVRIIQETLGGLPDQAVDRATQEVIRGGWLSTLTPGEVTEGPQDLVDETSAWAPGIGGSSARFEIECGVEALLGRAEDWVGHRQGRTSQYCDDRLRDFLKADVEDAPRRGRAFGTALSAALAAASPLVNIDAKVRARVHGARPEPDVFTLTPIPMAADHVWRAKIEAILRRHYADARYDPEGAFDVSGGAESLDIFGFSGESMHPVVCASAMEPIAREWSEAKGRPRTRGQFWAFRRSRPLEAFVPLSRRMQRELVRGWYSAAVLGYLAGYQADVGREPEPAVWAPGGYLEFPTPLLGPAVEDGRHVLPAVLESVPLCFVDAFQGSETGSKAYERLLEIAGRGAEIGALERWIERGTRETAKGGTPHLPKPVAEILERDGDTFDSRSAAARSQIDAAKAVAEAARAAAVRRDQSLKDHRRLEISDMVIVVLSDTLSRFEFLKEGDPGSKDGGEGAVAV